MKRKKSNIPARLLAWITAIAMVVCLLPVNMWEADAATTLKDPVAIYNSNGGRTGTTWDCVWFGSYPQSSDGNGGFKTEPIKWRVLSVNGDDAFLVADKNLDCKPYNTSCTDVTWRVCTMRSWLNGYSSGSNAYGTDYSSNNFIDAAFIESEQNAIMFTTVINEDNPNHGIEGGNDTEDQIYLLSISEIKNKSYWHTYDSEVPIMSMAKNTEYAEKQGATTPFENYGGIWWLRSPGDDSHSAAFADHVGGVFSSSVADVNYSSCAVRPALHLDLSSDVWSYAGTVSSNGAVNEVAPPVDPPASDTITKASQSIAGSTAFSKTYGNKPFSLGASAKTKLSYKSSNTEIATVSSDGIVTLKKVGTVKITITAAENAQYRSASKVVTITVGKGKQSISGKASLSKTYGNKPFGLGASAKTRLSYKSSNTDIATVSSDGVVTLKKAGTVKITVTAAESAQYRSASKAVTITVGKGKQSISGKTGISKTFGSKPFSLGTSAKTKLSYKSSNRKVVTVSSAGKVTLKNPGKAKITVKAAETGKYKAASKIVTINVKLKTPTLNAKKTGKKKVKLSWSKVPGAKKYEVYMYDAKKKKFVKQITKKANQRVAVHRGMKVGKTYKYKVRAYRVVDGEKVYSAFSKVKEVKVK